MNFISHTLGVIDRHKQFKGHYLIMDKAPIYTLDSSKMFI